MFVGNVFFFKFVVGDCLLYGDVVVCSIIVYEVKLVFVD